MSFLSELRNKSNHTKNMIAFSIAFMVMLCVSGIWLVTFSARLETPTTNEVVSEAPGDNKNTKGMFGGFFSSARDQFANVIESVKSDAPEEQEETSEYPATLPEPSVEPVVQEDTEATSTASSSVAVQNEDEAPTMEETQPEDQNADEEEPPEVTQIAQPRTVLIATSSSNTGE